MPRNPGVSGRSTIRLSVLSPRLLTMFLCFCGVQIVLRTYLILIIFPSAMVEPVSFLRPKAWLKLIGRQAAHVGNRRLVAQLLERVDGGLHNVVGIMRTERFGQHVRNSYGLNYRPHRTAGNDARACRGRLQKHQAAAELSEDFMPDGGFEHVDLAKILLRCLDALLDCGRHFFGLARAEPDNLLPRIADYDESRETHIFSALDYLRHAVDTDYLFLQVQALSVNTLGLSIGCHQLELQSCFTGGVGERLHPAMVEKTAPVKHDFRDALFLRALSYGLANRLCAFHVAALGLPIFFSRGGGRERVTL